MFTVALTTKKWLRITGAIFVFAYANAVLFNSLLALVGLGLSGSSLGSFLGLALGSGSLKLLLLGNALCLLLVGNLVSGGLLSLAGSLLGAGGLLLLGLGLHVCAAHLVGDDGVHQSHNAGLAVGSLVLVDDALGSSLVKQAASIQALGVCSGGVAGGNGLACSAHGGLQLGFASAVALTGLLVGDDALLLALDVCHVESPSILVSFAAA